MKKVYLCSRVAYDARPFNEEVAIKLEEAGYQVYVPHREAPNNLSAEDIKEGRYDTRTIFLMDYEALRKADVVVAVGRMGADCSWELGYAWAKSTPVVHVPGTDTTYKSSPMLLPTLQNYRTATVTSVVERVNVATHYEES